MERTSITVLSEMQEIIDTMTDDSIKWVEKGNSSASARLRKSTLALERLGKEFRKLSVKE